MSRRGAIHRYFLIIEKIKRVGCPSFLEISHYLKDQGFEINPRTLQRDIGDLRDEFDIEIKYDRQRTGYFIEDSAHEGATSIRYLEAAMEADILLSSFEDIRTMRDLVSFSDSGTLRGISQLQPLLFALKYRRVVEFDHENFGTGARKHFSVRPRHLKEYDGRWYLCAEIPGIQNILIFGIDRIDNLYVSDIVFDNPGPSIKSFEHIVGVSGLDEEPMDVVLEFSPDQGRYIKTLPIHASQEIVEEDEDRLVVSLYVVDNFELRQRILGFGSSVIVLEPEELAEEIEEELRKNLEKYRERHGLS